MDDQPTDHPDPEQTEPQQTVDPIMRAAMDAENLPLLEVHSRYLQQRVYSVRAECIALQHQLAQYVRAVEERDQQAADLHDTIQQLRQELEERDAAELEELDAPGGT